MTWSQRGIYRELLDWQWIEGSIPSDPVEAAQLLPMAELADVQAVLLMAFQPLEAVPKRSASGRLERERSILERWADVARDRAKKGAAASSRGSDGKFTASSGSQAVDIPPLVTASPSPSPSTKKKARARAGRGWEEILPDFKALDSEPVRAAIGRWTAYRSSKGLGSWVEATWRSQLTEGQSWGADAFVRSIDYTIRKGWQGLQREKVETSNGYAQKPSVGRAIETKSEADRTRDRAETAAWNEWRVKHPERRPKAEEIDALIASKLKAAS